ncbi:phage tail tape measure protein [Serratia sp. UGAL515B_01]|uniref:phage tail tape measure protein n=1 Tax=Serratia sp. UGAL515B_01 TaxID=2986763 RepID=UPI0029550619|nr:phage tail tape measure protein [Serratia sp. UGAL515B_01]WON77838.1 phage tail tape measure protein [Serratia sp. UGAL515B_01]
MADSFQLKAIITGVNKLSPQLTTMQKDLRKFKGEFKDVISSAGVVGAGIAAAFAMPIKSAIDFESTMADVKKVVDFDSNQQFKKMADDVLDLSTKLPMAANGIGEIVAAGGQAGIARDELLKFAEGAVKMGIAFDQTAEQSGQMMAQWRTAFKMTQDEVITLADKVNYLGNTGPANAAKISDIVTRIGPLGEVAGVASGEIAAMGATIAGMGVESEIASTGIKNFMLSLTAGGAATASQKKALKALKINPKTLAADMQKDAKGTMIRVLESMAKVPKAKQAAVMTALFGKESLGAIAPLLTNLDLLKVNFNKVSDAQQYNGSMQKEYASRAATTANALILLKGQVNAAAISIGDLFLPTIVSGTKKLTPYLVSIRNLIKENPELIKTTLKLGVYLMGVAVSVTAVTKAVAFMSFVTKMSPLGRLLAVLIAAGGLIVANWDKVGPVFKAIWDKIKPIVELFGGMENIMQAVAVFAAGAFALSFISGMGKSNAVLILLNRSLKTLLSFAGKSVAIGVLISLYEPFMDLKKNVDARKNKWESERNGKSDAELIAEHAKSGGSIIDKDSVVYSKLKSLFRSEDKASILAGKGQQLNGEITVKFDNAPPGMNVVSAVAGSPNLGITTDVGYNRFANR